MARWDKYWRDDAFVARNWAEPDSDIVRLSPVMQGHGVRTVLDLGSGAGRHLFYLSRHGFEVHGLDISATGVERCRKELEQHRLPATVQVADMFSLPYPDAYFDWALSVQVIHHTTAATLKQGIQHLRGKLKPGGFFYVTFPPVESIGPDSGREIEPRTYLKEEDGEPLLHHYVTAPEIDELLEGFTIVEKRLEPRESRDQAGEVTRRMRWNVLGQRS
ncbi:MAG: class I SAM-dependent methyltransferase [Nitrospinae bacterium]|nr:class I SAM-dependent methyltransferase [Nitrospinota bacterium]